VSDEIFDRLDALADEGDLEGVEAEALRAIKKAEDPRDLWRYVAWARFELDRLEQAVEAARTAEDPLLEGKALFHLWRFDDAAGAFDRFEGGGEEEAEVEWYRGVLAEFRGGDATRHFKRASKLAPDIFQEPVRLTDAQIDEVVRKAREDLPPPVKRAVEETTIEIVPLPNEHRDVDPLSLGLYTGRDMLSRSIEESGFLPPKSRSSGRTSSGSRATAPRRSTSCASRCSTRSATTSAWTRARSRTRATGRLRYPTRGGSMPRTRAYVSFSRSRSFVRSMSSALRTFTWCSYASITSRSSGFLASPPVSRMRTTTGSMRRRRSGSKP
jgi:hypothetical protein